jgi:hypothetical protein
VNTTTDKQFDEFEAHIDRLGLDSVATALGFMGERDSYEALSTALNELSEDDAAQALLKLAMTRW